MAQAILKPLMLSIKNSWLDLWIKPASQENVILVSDSMFSASFENGYAIVKYCSDHNLYQNQIYYVDHGNYDLRAIKANYIIKADSKRHISLAKKAVINIYSLNYYFSLPTNYFYHNYRYCRQVNWFLSHGEMYFKKMTKIYLSKAQYVTCANEFEYNYLKSFIQVNNLVKSGLARYSLYKSNSNTNKILVMPTWREKEIIMQSKEDVLQLYFDLCQNLKNNGYHPVFYKHQLIDDELIKSNGYDFEILKAKGANLTQLISEFDCVITDYSSIAIDFFRMNKQVLFYYPLLDDPYPQIRGIFNNPQDNFKEYCFSDQNKLILALKSSEKAKFNLETYYGDEVIKHVNQIEYILNNETFNKKRRGMSVLIEGIDFFIKEKKEFKEK